MKKHVGIIICNNLEDLKKQLQNQPCFFLWQAPYIIQSNLNYTEAIRVKENYIKNKGFSESRFPQPDEKKEVKYSVYAYLQIGPDGPAKNQGEEWEKINKELSCKNIYG